MSTFEQVRLVISENLSLGARGARLQPKSALFGEIPEFDFMAVLTVVTALEQQFGILFDDEGISKEAFLTVGSLVALVESKRAAA